MSRLALAAIGVAATATAAYAYTHRSSTRATADAEVDKNGEIVTTVPHQTLREGSVKVGTLKGCKFSDWTRQDHLDSYTAIQKIATVWNDRPFLAYGIQEAENDFHWEVVPYNKSEWKINYYPQQLAVLFRTIFGPTTLSKSTSNKLEKEYTQQLKQVSLTPPKETEPKEGCNFCPGDVVDNQQVLDGDHVQILYDYAPIGSGKEQLHFLVMPKAHRQDFRQITEAEYTEAMQLIGQMITKLKETRDLEDIHIFHKTGKEAGQTEKHLHMHVVAMTSKKESFRGKLTVARKMLYKKALPKDELAKRRTKYQKELASIAPEDKVDSGTGHL